VRRRDEILLATAVCGAASLIGCCIGLVAMTFPFAGGATAEVALIPALIFGGISLVLWPLRMPPRALLGVLVASPVIIGMVMILFVPTAMLIAPLALHETVQWAVLPVVGCAAVYLLTALWWLRDKAPRPAVIGALALFVLLLTVAGAVAALVAAFEGEALAKMVLRFAIAVAPVTALAFGLTAGWLAVLLGSARTDEPELSPSIEQALRADGREL